MSLLSTVHKGKQAVPPRIVVYGTEGIGKSTFASQAASPLFIQTEDGLAGIDCDSLPLVDKAESVQQALYELYTEDHDYQTVVIDSLDRLEQLIYDEVVRRRPSTEKGKQVTSIEDYGFGKGYTYALEIWREILEALDRLRMDKGIASILIAHAKVEKFDDPESQAYDRYSPRLNKHASALVCEWADAVLFCFRKFRTESHDEGFGKKRVIAAAVGSGGGDRVLRTVGGPTCVAKNRFNLPEELPLQWSALVTAMNGVRN